jgi:hypothetical protein
MGTREFTILRKRRIPLYHLISLTKNVVVIRTNKQKDRSQRFDDVHQSVAACSSDQFCPPVVLAHVDELK